MSSPAISLTFGERLEKRMAELPLDEDSIRKRTLLGNAREVKLAQAVVAIVKASRFGPIDAIKMAYAKMMHREGVKMMIMHEDMAAEKKKKEEEEAVANAKVVAIFRESMEEAHRVINLLRETKQSVHQEEGALNTVYDAIRELDSVIRSAKTHKRKAATDALSTEDKAEEDKDELKKQAILVGETTPKRAKIVSTVHVVKVRGGTAHCVGCNATRVGWSVLEGSPLRVACDLCHFAMEDDQAKFSTDTQ